LRSGDALDILAPMRATALWLSLGMTGCGAAAASGAGPTTPAATAPAATAPAATAVVVGETSREEILRAAPAFGDEAARADVEEQTARALATVPAGAEVRVYLGTWCGDSRRELGRLFRALELVPEPWPFTLTLVGVDRARSAPGLTESVGLRYVPTFVVLREGAEVGRIIESAPRGIERELLDLLTGARTGVVSGRTDL